MKKKTNKEKAIWANGTGNVYGGMLLTSILFIHDGQKYPLIIISIVSMIICTILEEHYEQKERDECKKAQKSLD